MKTQTNNIYFAYLQTIPATKKSSWSIPVNSITSGLNSFLSACYKFIPTLMPLGIFAGLLFASSLLLYCRDRSCGLPYIENYTPKHYRAQPQNWWIIQDKRGIIYVANVDGLLEYDGISWRKFNIPNISVRSLALDENGTVYAAGCGEIGCLTPAPCGTLQYQSLLDKLPLECRKFGDVYRAQGLNHGVYFNPLEYLFRWNPQTGEMAIERPGSKFFFSFTARDTLYIEEETSGLKCLSRDGLSLSLVPGGGFFAGKIIYMLEPYDKDRLLIGTKNHGFFLYDGNKAEPFPTGADDYLRTNFFYRGTRLASGKFALGTKKGGLVIIDDRGKLQEIFNEACGLQDNNVRYVFEDRENNLWLALDRGLSKIEYHSPVSIYDDRCGLRGLVLSVTRHNNVLYAGTTYGLYYLEEEQERTENLLEPAAFQPVPGVTADCRSLLSCGDYLLAAASGGVFQVGVEEKKTAAAGFNVTCVTNDMSNVLLQSSRDKKRAWTGTQNGLYSCYLHMDTGRWQREQVFETINDAVYTIVEEEAGNLWLGTLTGRVIYVEFLNPPSITQYKVTTYSQDDGLPLEEIHVFYAAGHVMFATAKGIYRTGNAKDAKDAKDEKDEKDAKKVFIPDSTFGPGLAADKGSSGVYRIVEDNRRNAWIHTKQTQNILATARDDGTYDLQQTPFLRFAGYQANAIYPDPQAPVVWFGCNEGLVRFDKSTQKNYRFPFAAIIRRVECSDRLLFDGYSDKNSSPSTLSIKYKNSKNLHFSFAASFYEGLSANTFRYFLEGYDDSWSPWTTENKKGYTTLSPGTYCFHVQARNIYGHAGSEDTFRFSILPPWYATWWALSGYALLSLSFIFLFVRWRSGKLARENRKLECVIKERTKEIAEKNRQLEEQSVKLKEMDQMKSRFFANISHEFRTPLTLIMGPIEQMLSSAGREPADLKKLHLMLCNSQRLLTLINQLLELSKFESGKVKLQAEYRDIIPFLKGIVNTFEAAADKHDLDLSFRCNPAGTGEIGETSETSAAGAANGPAKNGKTGRMGEAGLSCENGENTVMLYFDPAKLEEVIFNLLSNALKFTPKGGQVTVTAAVRGCPGEAVNFPGGVVEISVSDSGPGISREQLDHIFDRFYQADTTYEHHRKGSGIGLAIAKELVELHHGSIDVHSVEGKGTTFTIRLPLGKTHLGSEEIAANGMAPVDPQRYIQVELEEETETGLFAGMETDETGETVFDGEEAKDQEVEKDIILVVEDSSQLREYIKVALEPLYWVVEAADGEEGLKKAREINPALIISDIMMPGIDGYRLCREIKNNLETSHIPVILLTAMASEENIIQGLETGADDYITKPFNTKILLTRIKNLVELRRHMQQTVSREMTLRPVEIPVSQLDNKFRKKLRKVIEENISDPEFNIERLCRELDISQPTLYRKILAFSGESPTEFIRSYRLKRGAELLKKNAGSVLEVAFEVGFSSAGYFSKCFKKKFHQLPSSFMAANRE